MSLLPHALKAVQQGLHIFPVEPGEKTPIRIHQDRTKDDAPWTIKWSEVATNDINKVIEWWTWCPMANIGVACQPSNILVIDCDAAKVESPYACKGTPYEYMHDTYGALVDGTDVLTEVCRRFGQSFDQLLRTYRVCTTRMGLHLYYRWPSSVVASQASIVPGILDVRTNGGNKGGYVLGAGSQTSSGAYAVEGTAEPIAVAPRWIEHLFTERPPLRQPDKQLLRQPATQNYSGLVATVQNAREGDRNQSLLWAARSMCSDGASVGQAENELVPAAMSAGLHEREARATIRSAYRVQQMKEGR